MFFLKDLTFLSTPRFCDLIVDSLSISISHVYAIANSVSSDNKFKTFKEPYCTPVSNFVRLALYFSSRHLLCLLGIIAGKLASPLLLICLYALLIGWSSGLSLSISQFLSDSCCFSLSSTYKLPYEAHPSVILKASPHPPFWLPQTISMSLLGNLDGWCLYDFGLQQALSPLTILSINFAVASFMIYLSRLGTMKSSPDCFIDLMQNCPPPIPSLFLFCKEIY